MIITTVIIFGAWLVLLAGGLVHEFCRGNTEEARRFREDSVYLE